MLSFPILFNGLPNYKVEPFSEPGTLAWSKKLHTLLCSNSSLSRQHPQTSWVPATGSFFGQGFCHVCF